MYIYSHYKTCTGSLSLPTHYPEVQNVRTQMSKAKVALDIKWTSPC